jgi:hypothetical protein
MAQCGLKKAALNLSLKLQMMQLELAQRLSQAAQAQAPHAGQPQLKAKPRALP